MIFAIILERNTMSKFVSSYNQFLTTMQIKQNYISRKSGIEENKLSRILTGKQPASETDLEALSTAAEKTLQYFLSQNFSVKKNYQSSATRIVFFTLANPQKKQSNIANNLLELMENVDVILSARDSFLCLEE